MHGDRVLHDGHHGAMWLTVIGVWEKHGKGALLLWQDGDSGAGILDPLPNDMKVLSQTGPQELKNYLGSEFRTFTFPFVARSWLVKSIPWFGSLTFLMKLAGHLASIFRA
jgi:hypothetical protein